jgi:hypothetical protein
MKTFGMNENKNINKQSLKLLLRTFFGGKMLKKW